MSWEAYLKAWLEQEKEGCVNSITKLIEDDAPKNKFAIVTGRLRALEDMETEIQKFLLKSRDPQGHSG